MRSIPSCQRLRGGQGSPQGRSPPPKKKQKAAQVDQERGGKAEAGAADEEDKEEGKEGTGDKEEGKGEEGGKEGHKEGTDGERGNKEDEEGKEDAGGGDAAAVAAATTAAAVPEELSGSPICGMSLEAVLTKALVAQIKADGDTQLPVQSPDTLVSCLALSLFAATVINLKSVDELDKHKTLFKTRLATAQQVRDAISKPSQKVTSHLDNRKREAEHTQLKVAREKEREAVASAKKKAKSAARDIEAAERKIPKLFEIDTSIFTDQKMACSEEVATGRANEKAPLLLNAPCLERSG